MDYYDNAANKWIGTCLGEYDGNINQNTEKYHTFLFPLSTQKVRIIPTASYGRTSMRIQLYSNNIDCGFELYPIWTSTICGSNCPSNVGNGWSLV